MTYRYLNKNYNLKVIYFKQDDYFEIRAYEVNYNLAAFVNFKVYNKNKYVWLNYLETKEEFQNQGYATALLKTMEFFLKTIKINKIQGNFSPKNIYAKLLYEKNGYMIFKDGYDTLLYKNLDFDKIKDEIEPNISFFEIIKLKNDIILEK